MASPFGSEERREASKAFITACEKGSDGVVRRLLAWGGTDVNYCDPVAGTAMATYVARGDWHMTMLLLEAGLDFQEYASPPPVPCEVMETPPTPQSVNAYISLLRVSTKSRLVIVWRLS
jgi:hypothetical protein